MRLQWAGVVLAVVTVVTIGLGHVMVRRFHARWGTRPAIPFFALSAVVLAAALFSANDLLSAIFGLTAITLFWDGVEIFRQEKRMRHSR